VIWTASWRTVAQTMSYGAPPFQPVRTSRGLPRFIGGAEDFPSVPELAPAGWLFSIQDNEKLNRAYRAQLHRIGPERLRSRFSRARRSIPGRPGSVLLRARPRSVPSEPDQCPLAQMVRHPDPRSCTRLQQTGRPGGAGSRGRSMNGGACQRSDKTARVMNTLIQSGTVPADAGGST
jgi:hypothetical protein